MKLHIDPDHIARLDPFAPDIVTHIEAVVGTALQLGGNAAAATVILIAAIGTLAARTDSPGCVLTVAWTMIDEELGDVAADMRRELRMSDSDSSGGGVQ